MNHLWRIILTTSILVGAGCAQIPQPAIDVSRQVSSGISALGTNGQDMVTAWEEVAYALLDERWSQIYRKAESDYRTKRQLAKTVALNSEQQEEVAGLATLMRDESRKKIGIRSADMRKIIDANTKTTLEANDSVTRLLVSAKSVLSGQQETAKQLADQVKIPSDASKFVSDLLKP
jgi:hypothetical protein